MLHMNRFSVDSLCEKSFVYEWTAQCMICGKSTLTGWMWIFTKMMKQLFCSTLKSNTVTHFVMSVNLIQKAASSILTLLSGSFWDSPLIGLGSHAMRRSGRFSNKKTGQTLEEARLEIQEIGHSLYSNLRWTKRLPLLQGAGHDLKCCT